VEFYKDVTISCHSMGFPSCGSHTTSIGCLLQVV
jgi:hypothetical protein